MMHGTVRMEYASPLHFFYSVLLLCWWHMSPLQATRTSSIIVRTPSLLLPTVPTCQQYCHRDILEPSVGPVLSWSLIPSKTSYISPSFLIILYRRFTHIHAYTSTCVQVRTSEYSPVDKSRCHNQLYLYLQLMKYYSQLRSRQSTHKIYLLAPLDLLHPISRVAEIYIPEGALIRYLVKLQGIYNS